MSFYKSCKVPSSFVGQYERFPSDSMSVVEYSDWEVVFEFMPLLTSKGKTKEFLSRGVFMPIV